MEVPKLGGDLGGRAPPCHIHSPFIPFMGLTSIPTWNWLLLQIRRAMELVLSGLPKRRQCEELAAESITFDYLGRPSLHVPWQRFSDGGGDGAPGGNQWPGRCLP